MLRAGGGPELLRNTKYAIVRFTRGKGLDIGIGPWKAFPHFIGVREKGDAEMPPKMEADFTVDSFSDISGVIEGEPLDFIFNWSGRAIMAQCVRLLKVGGFYITADEDFKVIVRRKVDDETIEAVDQRANTVDGRKTVCVTRYGAIGDMLQTASLLPELRRQGYFVVVNSHPDGEVILKEDPNVDTFWVQDRDQVPNGELVAYWKWLVKQFDRHINLCESVEGTLLTYPDRSNYRWPQAVRHKYCNRNYLEFMAELGELPFHPEHHFYPSAAEQKWADDFMARISRDMNKDTPPMGRGKTPFVVLWALSGSSVHKFWPHQDAIVARMMLEIPNIHVIFTGDEACQILEQGWENEPRISCLSGRVDLRRALTLAKMSQLVIGPETGTLNAVAFESMAKIVMLSHSSHENLTRDWVNTEALHSHITPCYPCHRMHVTHEFCPQDEETGAAMCQVELLPADVWDAVQRAYVGWGTVRSLLGKTQAPDLPAVQLELPK